MKMQIALGFALLCAIAVICEATVAEEDRVLMIPKYKQHNHDQMVSGARSAREELRKRKMAPQVVAEYPSRDTSGSDQISFVRNATQDPNTRAILLSNTAGKELEEFTLEAHRRGMPVVTYDSPLKGGRDAGESLFVAPVDFGKTGMLMADMALSILGEEGGDFVIESTTRTSANQNGWIASLKDALQREQKYSKLRLVGEEVYFPEEHTAAGHEQITLEIVKLKLNNTLPNLRLIMLPTTSGAAAAARALHENGHCGILQVSGLALPAEMLEASQAGCAPEFALWSNLDVGYLAYHATHALLNGRIEGKAGERIDAGRLGTRTVEDDPDRENALRVLSGDFVLYTEENVERAAFVDCAMNACDENIAQYLEDRFIEKYKKKALAIIPKVTGMLSFLCSGFLVQHILRSKKQRTSMYSRLILGLSSADMFSSFFGFFLSTWPMPSGTWLAYGASGNQRTCEMQGFFFQLGLCAATLYQASLVSFYFLTIARGWSKSKVQKYEWFFHSLPCSVAVGTAVAGLFLQLYNPMPRGNVCWIQESPPYCVENFTCERGENADIYRWGFVYGFVLVTFIYLACAMGCIYYGVRKTERRSESYRQPSMARINNHSQRRDVAAQALLYSVAYAIPWIWGLVLSFINTGTGVFNSSGIDNAVTALNIVNAFIFPLQGFLNVFVYVRPRYKEEKRKHPEMNLLQMAVRTFFSDADVEYVPRRGGSSGMLRRTSVRLSNNLPRRKSSKKSSEEKDRDAESNIGSSSKKAAMMEQDATGMDKSPVEDAQSWEPTDLSPDARV